MFKHLLVPLDGSRLAEAPLSMAVFLARALEAQVTLFHVIERDAPREIHGEPHLNNPNEAVRYLDGIATSSFFAGLRVACHVHEESASDVAQSIVDHAVEFGCDLVVMCTHGRGGLHRFIFGRIAQQVTALGTIPVLLVPPAIDGAVVEFSCSSIMVALDGNPDHEAGLPEAVALARSLGATVFLAMAVPTLTTLTGEQSATARMLPGTTVALLDLAEQDAEVYLRGLAAALEAEGITVSASVRRGDPVTHIIRAAEETGADLIVLATHGKTGMDAFWSGSATPIIAGRTERPLLLVPVGKEVAESQE